MSRPFCFHPQVAPWLKQGPHGLSLTLFTHRQTPLQAAWIETPDAPPLALTRTAQHGELLLWCAELPRRPEQEACRYRFRLLIDGRPCWLHAGGLDGAEPGFEHGFHTHGALRPPQWAQDQVVYQLEPEGFCTGEPAGAALAGIQNRLYYLQSLGVTALYLNPLAAPDKMQQERLQADVRVPHEAQLAELGALLHQRGMRLLLDAEPYLACERHAVAAQPPNGVRLPQGIDGWRLAPARGPERTTAPEQAQALCQALKQDNPDTYLLGERPSGSLDQGGLMDGIVNEQGFTDPVRAFLAGQDVHGQPLPLSARELLQRLQQARMLLPLSSQLSQLNLLDGHASPRLFSLLQGDLALMRAAVTLLFTYTGVPCIFYGDEIGLQDGAEPDSRHGFPWDSTQWHHLLHDHYRRLIRLRKTHPALRRGDFHKLHAGEHSLVFARTLESDVVLTALNRHPDKARTLRLPIWQTGSLASRFTDPETRDKFEVVKGEIQLTIPPRTARVLLAS